jgi:hypothetical protein
MLEREYNAVGSGNKEECNNQMILFADRTSSLVRYGEILFRYIRSKYNLCTL